MTPLSIGSGSSTITSQMKPSSTQKSSNPVFFSSSLARWSPARSIMRQSAALNFSKRRTVYMSP